MWKWAASVVAVIVSCSVYAAPAPTTVVDYFNTWSRSTTNRWQVIQKKSEWVASDSQWGDDVFVPVTVDFRNGFLSFVPNSGDSKPKVEAAVFRRTSGGPYLVVSDSNIDDTLSTCSVAAYDFSTGKPVDVTKTVFPVLNWKDFLDNAEIVTQVQNYKPIQKYLTACYSLPQVGTTVTAGMHSESLNGEVERYESKSYPDDGSAGYKNAMAHLPLMKRVANMMTQKKISLKWDKEIGRFVKK